MTFSDDTPAPGSKGERINELHNGDGRMQNRPEEGDEKSVSSPGKSYDMNRIREAVENAPDIRDEKVAVLKKMIASGEYKVNAREVADKMIKEFLSDDVLKR